MAFKYYCTQCGQSDYVSGRDYPHRCANCGSLEGAEAKQQPAPAEAVKRSLFDGVQSILDLAEYYLPGELAENPEQVRADVQRFRDYRAYMQKQLEEKEQENTRLRELCGRAADMLEVPPSKWLYNHQTMKYEPVVEYFEFLADLRAAAKEANDGN